MTLEEIEKQIDGQIRDRQILRIVARRAIEPNNDGVSLNEGYDYEVDGALPQLADALAKMLLEMNKDKSFGENAGSMFLTLLTEYYNRLKEE